MTSNGMKQQLEGLYNENWETLKVKLNDILVDQNAEYKPTNPLLISLENNDYENCEIKVVIFGQETNSWYGNFNGDVEKILAHYTDFFNNGYALNEYGGQFWNGVNRFLELLKKKYPNEKIGVLWNNIIKIGCAGRNQNTPPEYIYKIEKEHFNIVKTEIDILKPNIILFLSGPNYDHAIGNAFGKFELDSIGTEFSKRQLSKLNIAKNVFRTYHPSYLWRTKKINEYFNTIISEIK